MNLLTKGLIVTGLFFTGGVAQTLISKSEVKGVLMLDNYVKAGAVDTKGLLNEVQSGCVIQCSPATEYVFKNSLVFTKSVTITGYSTTVNRSTVFKFPIDSAGLSFIRTDSSSSVGNSITGIWFDGGHRENALPKHGLWATGRTDLTNCVFEGFAGHGVYLDGTGTKGSNGNVNRNMLTNCRFSKNGRNGLHIDGNDANVVNVINCDASNNEGHGFYDGAMMCNLYLSPHSNNNGLKGGKITHQCIRWFALTDSVPKGIEPLKSPKWELYWDTLQVAKDGRCLQPTGEFQAWKADRAYKTSRPFCFVGNTRHTIINPYVEQNQAASYLDGGTLVINGAITLDPKSRCQWIRQETNGVSRFSNPIKTTINPL